jgi:ATP-dependent exoDNAse (exonuclease V) beta subunit
VFHDEALDLSIVISADELEEIATIATEISNASYSWSRAITAQLLAGGALDHEELVRQLADSALASEIVQRAAAREHWRETFVGSVQADGVVLEGYVDLIYREDDGSLVIVDYKTDAVPGSAIPSRVTYYKPQMDAYRQALAAATGAKVSITLLFLNPSGAAPVAV